MSSINKSFILIAAVLSLNQLIGQTEQEQQIYWIYTYYNEFKDYQINGIEGDELIINNGNWDVKIPLDELELILRPPKPGLLGKVLGGGLGGYCCGAVGIFLGLVAWVIAGGQDSTEGIIMGTGLAGALAGAYYGSRFGGNLLKGQPELMVDMNMWTVDEKKEWFQNSLISSY